MASSPGEVQILGAIIAFESGHQSKFGGCLLMWQQFGQTGHGVPLLQIQHPNLISRGRWRPEKIGQLPLLEFYEMTAMSI